MTRIIKDPKTVLTYLLDSSWSAVEGSRGRTFTCDQIRGQWALLTEGATNHRARRLLMSRIDAVTPAQLDDMVSEVMSRTPRNAIIDLSADVAGQLSWRMMAELTNCPLEASAEAESLAMRILRTREAGDSVRAALDGDLMAFHDRYPRLDLTDDLEPYASAGTLRRYINGVLYRVGEIGSERYLCERPPSYDISSVGELCREKEGDAIFLKIAAAARSAANDRLTFGYGRHYCPGRPGVLALEASLVQYFNAQNLIVSVDSFHKLPDDRSGIGIDSLRGQIVTKA